LIIILDSDQTVDSSGVATIHVYVRCK